MRLDWIRERWPGLHRFLTRTDAPWPVVRDVGGIALFGLVLYLVLISATGQFLHGPPVVVVESGSMMHCQGGVDLGHSGRGCDPERYGRFGTIDPGDLIFVRDVDYGSDIVTFASGTGHRYGAAGDTIIYQAEGSAIRTPVIHRAMFWLKVEENGTFSIPELGRSGLAASDLTVSGLDLDAAEYRLGASCSSVVSGAHALTWESSGFVTKGDNNACFDQSSQGFGYNPVRPEWVIGKARGELPWIGLIKLWAFDLLQGTSNYDNAPRDVRTMMWVSIVLLVGAPFAVETVVKRVRDRWADQKDDARDEPERSERDDKDRP